MKYFWLSARDEPQVNWILFRVDKNRSLRKRYESLACNKCGRVNALTAVQTGFDSDVRVRSKFDYFTSDDGLKCVSKRGRSIIEESGATGLEFLSLPSDKHYVILPMHRIPVARKLLGTRIEQTLDLAAITRNPRSIDSDHKDICIASDSCGMEFHGDKCEACDRYFQSLYWPTLRSMALPDDPLLVATPDVMMENLWSSETWLLASNVIVESLQRAGLRGLDPLEAA